jgi:hypothetical protein
MFLNGVAIFFYSVVAVPRSAVPSALKAAKFSASALQQSALLKLLGQHIYFTVVPDRVQLAAKYAGSHTFLSCELPKQWDRREHISIVEKHCLQTDLR